MFFRPRFIGFVSGLSASMLNEFELAHRFACIIGQFRFVFRGFWCSLWCRVLPVGLPTSCRRSASVRAKRRVWCCSL